MIIGNAYSEENTPLKVKQNERLPGFTLVEVMVVVVVVGLLATMAIAAFNKNRRITQNTTFVNDLRVLVEAAEQFMLETGLPLESADARQGEIPTGFDVYISGAKWFGETPIGGTWETEYNSAGVTSAIGVHRPSASGTQLQEIDDDFDDGDLATGQIRRLSGNHIFYILVE